jgi:hypothetical protein
MVHGDVTLSRFRGCGCQNLALLGQVCCPDFQEEYQEEGRTYQRHPFVLRLKYYYELMVKEINQVDPAIRDNCLLLWCQTRATGLADSVMA